MKRTLCALALLCAATASAQRVRIYTQSQEVKKGTGLPAACTVGDLFFKTNATAGQNWYGCTATNTWTLQSGGGTSDFVNFDFAGQTSTTLTHNLGTTAVSTTCVDNAGVLLSPMVSITSANAVAVNFAVSTTGTCTVTRGSARSYIVSVSGQTSVSVLGSSHGLARVPRTDCFDSGGARVEPMQSVNGSYDVTLSFSSAFTGSCALI